VNSDVEKPGINDIIPGCGGVGPWPIAVLIVVRIAAGLLNAADPELILYKAI